MNKLNLGCGFDHRPGWVNADCFKECKPDIVVDISETPWPFPDNEFDHILLKHVLEHVGKDYAEFKRIMQELYRVIRHNGSIEIYVPHFTHSTFWSDPTHVRAFTRKTFEMMSKKQNDLWIKERANYSMIAYDMKVNFEIIEALQFYDDDWLEKEEAGEITRKELQIISQEQWNVIKEIKVIIKAIKPFHQDEHKNQKKTNNAITNF